MHCQVNLTHIISVGYKLFITRHITHIHTKTILKITILKTYKAFSFIETLFTLNTIIVYLYISILFLFNFYYELCQWAHPFVGKRNHPMFFLCLMVKKKETFYLLALGNCQLIMVYCDGYSLEVFPVIKSLIILCSMNYQLIGSY